ncbi:unnamed protein product [Bursaphelenchus xylophilus]|uniref:(pine wood nematode) hypothetical protein n=1 Tax=Bursaphelenchus xylophilus TaxID=6326 RepID=A0A1I7S6E8_BURXY|nr:unnamed protein product [Bursaphelenchus xylophilus]CAG9128063.1 unnamed protein product [Bursaphelenchus xylophilus]
MAKLSAITYQLLIPIRTDPEPAPPRAGRGHPSIRKLKSPLLNAPFKAHNGRLKGPGLETKNRNSFKGPNFQRTPQPHEWRAGRL